MKIGEDNYQFSIVSELGLENNLLLIELKTDFNDHNMSKSAMMMESRLSKVNNESQI